MVISLPWRKPRDIIVPAARGNYTASFGIPSNLIITYVWAKFKVLDSQNVWPAFQIQEGVM